MHAHIHIQVFVAMLGIVMFGFVFAFMLEFGNQLESFSTPSRSFDALFKTMLGDFDYDALITVSGVQAYLARIYFILYIVVVVLLMLNMFLAIVMNTYDIVASQLAKKARTEVTGVSILKQNLQALGRLISAHTLDDLKKVSPEESTELSGLYGQERDIFDRDYLTEVEFRALFAGDDAALHRIGVRSVEELMMYVDVTGKPRLDMHEVHEYLDNLKKAAGKKDEELIVSFAPFQLSQMRQTVEGSMEHVLDDSVKALKTYIHNQISQVRYTYVYIYIYMYIYLRIHTYIYTHTHTHIYIYIY